MNTLEYLKLTADCATTEGAAIAIEDLKLLLEAVDALEHIEFSRWLGSGTAAALDNGSAILFKLRQEGVGE